jgi:hypothetical protein
VVEEKDRLDTHKVLGIYLTSLFICYLCSSTHLTSWLVHVELQQSNLARDAHTVKDAVPMPVVPYNKFYWPPSTCQFPNLAERVIERIQA